MPDIDKATGRAVLVVALLVLAGVALRGYLPPAVREPDEEPTSSPASSIAIAALLTVALSILAFAALTSPRRARQRAAVGDTPAWQGRGSWRPGWRVVLVGLAVLLAWLLIAVLVSRLSLPQPAEPTGPTAWSSSPAPTTALPAPPPGDVGEDVPEQGGDAFIYLAVATVMMVLTIALSAVVDARRKYRAWRSADRVADDYLPPAPKPASESLVRAAELGLAEIGDLSREPRQAIIACYSAMERALADAGEVPQDSDTPSEVLARAVEHHALHADSATELVDLFAEARFSPHVMTEEHRDVAVRVLRLVLAELRSVT